MPERVTLPKFGNMSLKLGTVEMLFEHPVVPLMQRNAVVIDHSSSINLPLQVSIPLVLIKLKLQRLHATIVVHNSTHCNQWLARKLFKFAYQKWRRINLICTVRKWAEHRLTYSESLSATCPSNCSPTDHVAYIPRLKHVGFTLFFVSLNSWT